MAAFRWCDIVFHNNYLKLFIEKDKNDIYSEGNKVDIVKINNTKCPYILLQNYFQMGRIQDDSDEYIFINLTYFKSSNIYKA